MDGLTLSPDTLTLFSDDSTLSPDTSTLSPDGSILFLGGFLFLLKKEFLVRNSCGFIYYLLELYWQWLFIGQLSHFGLVGRQISLPRKEIAIPISLQMFFGSICINCFSTLFPSLVSVQSPILYATILT